MADAVPIVGGPFDGCETTPGLQFAHLEQPILKRALPGPGRELYVFENGTYIYADNRWARCSCGGYVRKAEGGAERIPCPLCGKEPDA